MLRSTLLVLVALVTFQTSGLASENGPRCAELGAKLAQYEEDVMALLARDTKQAEQFVKDNEADFEVASEEFKSLQCYGG